jgi:hypothetical protein
MNNTICMCKLIQIPMYKTTLLNAKLVNQKYHNHRNDSSIEHHNLPSSRLVIGTSRTVGSAKKFVRITSGVGVGEFTKTLRKVCTCPNTHVQDNTVECKIGQPKISQSQKWQYGISYCLFVCLIVFNATFNNISVISWQSVLIHQVCTIMPFIL